MRFGKFGKLVGAQAFKQRELAMVAFDWQNPASLEKEHIPYLMAKIGISPRCPLRRHFSPNCAFSMTVTNFIKVDPHRQLVISIEPMISPNLIADQWLLFQNNHLIKLLLIERGQNLDLPHIHTVYLGFTLIRDTNIGYTRSQVKMSFYNENLYLLLFELTITFVFLIFF